MEEALTKFRNESLRASSGKLLLSLDDPVKVQSCCGHWEPWDIDLLRDPSLADL